MDAGGSRRALCCHPLPLPRIWKRESRLAASVRARERAAARARASVAGERRVVRTFVTRSGGRVGGRPGQRAKCRVYSVRGGAERANERRSQLGCGGMCQVHRGLGQRVGDGRADGRAVGMDGSARMIADGAEASRGRRATGSSRQPADRRAREVEAVSETNGDAREMKKKSGKEGKADRECVLGVCVLGTAENRRAGRVRGGVC